MTGVSATFANQRPTMNTHVKLDGHYIDQTRDRIGVGAIPVTVTLGGGTVEFPAPFLPIGGGLAVMPAIAPDGDTAVRIDFTRWIPLRYGQGSSDSLPLYLNGQSLAVRICRAFDADPRTHWRQSADEVRAWLEQWARENPDWATT